jgi:Flp pilus assembly protein TadB
MDERKPAASGEVSGGSTADLVKQMSEQVSRLVRDELRLAQREMTDKGKRAGAGLGMISGGGMIALYGLACLIAAAVIGLTTALAAWLAALVIGAGLLIAAAAAAGAGKAQLAKAAPPVPEQAIGSVKADVDELKESAHR